MKHVVAAFLTLALLFDSCAFCRIVPIDPDDDAPMVGEGQGGAYVWWDPIYPSPTYDRYEWTLIVQDLPITQSFYFWALQNGFANGGTFYLGLQPYGSCPGGGNCKLALFSYFGNGSNSTSTSCKPGADGGAGMSCKVPYNWVVGRPYRFVMTLSASTATLNTWTCTVADARGGPATTIGAWSIPVSRGRIGRQGVSFVEYYLNVPGGCTREPYAKVTMSVPIGFTDGIPFCGSVRDTTPTAACASYAKFERTATSVTVQTGVRRAEDVISTAA